MNTGQSDLGTKCRKEKYVFIVEQINHKLGHKFGYTTKEPKKIIGLVGKNVGWNESVKLKLKENK